MAGVRGAFEEVQFPTLKGVLQMAGVQIQKRGKKLNENCFLLIHVKM